MAQWLEKLNRLLDDVAAWSREEGWLVKESPKEIRDDGALPPYLTKTLLIELESSEARIRVDPISSSVHDADGRVDICAWPSLHRFMLVLKGKRWVLKTDSGVPGPKPWNRQNFVELAGELAHAA